jgi:hypothetical protein
MRAEQVNRYVMGAMMCVISVFLLSGQPLVAHEESLSKKVEKPTQTDHGLSILSVSPKDGADVDPSKATIHVTFDRPVVSLSQIDDPSSLPSPFVSSPRIPGNGRWVNASVYQFTPSMPLEGAHVYTLRINAGLKALDGSVLQTPFTWRVRSMTEQFPVITATIGVPDGTFQIDFHSPMDHALTEAAVTLRSYDDVYPGDGYFSFPTEFQTTEVAFSWNDEGSVLTLTPKHHLEYARFYRVILPPGLRTASGALVTPDPYDDGNFFATKQQPIVSETSPSSEETMPPTQTDSTTPAIQNKVDLLIKSQFPLLNVDDPSPFIPFNVIGTPSVTLLMTAHGSAQAPYVIGILTVTSCGMVAVLTVAAIGLSAFFPGRPLSA